MNQVVRWFAKGSAKRFLPVCTLGIAACFVAAGSKVDWLLTPKHSYIVLPPNLITDGEIQRAGWSPDGAFLLVAATPRLGASISQILEAAPPRGRAPHGGVLILAWDRSHQGVRKLWSTDDPSLDVWSIDWLKGSNTAYITIAGDTTGSDRDNPAFGVLAIDAATGHYSWVPGMEHLSHPPTIIPSPLKPTAIAVFDDRPEAATPPGAVQPTLDTAVAVSSGAVVPSGPASIPTVLPEGAYIPRGATNFWTLAPGGEVVHRIQTPPSGFIGISWSLDGSRWYVTSRNRKTKDISVAELTDGGNFTQVNAQIYVAPKEQNPEVWIHTKPMIAKQRKVQRGLSNLWISSPQETNHPDVLVSPSGLQPQLAPSQDAVFYVESGIAKVRALVTLTEDQKRALYAALRSEAISEAKQVALGLLMYSMDCDDQFPAGSSFDDIDPYLKNRELMDDFTYTPPSELGTTKIANPASTVLGYVDGPGGRAVAYSDGHVGWIPNP